MDLLDKIKIGSMGLLASIVVILWAFGGAIGCIVGIVKNEAIFAVASLLVPGFGAIYTVIAALKAIF